MKALQYFLISSVLLLGFTSCTKDLTPFTERLKKEQNWSEGELKQIQFYLSKDVILYRAARTGSSEIESGEIKIVNGKEVEEVRILEGTPGVLTYFPKENRMGIRFEDGGEQRYLMFGPNQKLGGAYVMLAKEWKGRKGTVTYDGKEYYMRVDNAIAMLMVNMKVIRKANIKQRKAGGVKVNG